VPFDISFHLSTGTHPTSKPGTLLLYQSLLAQEVFVGHDQAGDAVYRYDAYLPFQFNQTPGTEYFLDIDKPSGEDWGWHDAGGTHPNGDYAAYSLGDHSGPWFTEPAKTDLAFEIMIPEPGTGALALLGGGGLLFLRLRRRSLRR
jgi:hypothetical protein